MVLKDKLIIIGNGFDLWQGLHTRYSDFTKFYQERREDILKKLFIRSYIVEDNDGGRQKISDVELIYGDAFDPGELDADFWNNFEESLAYIEDQRVNLYFGKEKAQLKSLARSVRNTKRILERAFIEWLSTIEIAPAETPYAFDDSCTFLSFNYTHTLQKRFNVPPKDIYFIHGEAYDRKSIIFGHSSQPEPPEDFAKILGGRFLGLYHIDKLRYELDKQVGENIELYCMYLGMMCIMPQDIKNVYVLGHSFGRVDLEYFRFLVDATRASATWHISCFSEEDRRKVRQTMAALGFDNYSLYENIDICLESFLKMC